MKALVKLRPEKGIWMADVPMPHVRINDVLIKIKKDGHLRNRFAYLQMGRVVATNHKNPDDHWA